MNHPARHWHPIGDGRIKCDLCPRDCKLGEGQRGACFVRQRENDAMVLTTYGRSSGFCIDPIEKKPLNHFHPGSSVLSFGTAGCNLACKFCQNWDISKASGMDRLMDEASPERIALAAKAAGCRSVAFTYNDPVIFMEYALDVADACHDLGIDTVAVTAGYLRDAPRREFFSKMDAANVDLKAFSESFYLRQTGGHLRDVLDTLLHIRHETRVWLEITTLLIPGLNDSVSEISALCAWVAEHLGPDVPLHFTAFHPDYKLADWPKTPRETLLMARKTALAQGLRHVYIGNVGDLEGATTSCRGCGATLIVRNWHEIVEFRAENGICPDCGARLPGRFGAFSEHFGNRRIPVRI